MHTLDTFIAKYFIGIAILAAGYFFLKLPKDQKKRFVIEAVIGGVIAMVLAKVGSKLFYNPRPFVVGHFMPYFSHGNDNGFPSDHTLLSSFLGFLVLRYNKKWGYALLILAAVIGLSRVIAGVHHIVDILGSFLFAGAGMLVAYHATRRAVKPKG